MFHLNAHALFLDGEWKIRRKSNEVRSPIFPTHFMSTAFETEVALDEKERSSSVSIEIRMLYVLLTILLYKLYHECLKFKLMFHVTSYVTL